MHHGDAGGGTEFDGEIPVADGVQRILGDVLEAELAGRECAIDGKRGSGQRRGAERHHVGAAPAVGETLSVAYQHLMPGQQVMAEGHRLGGLQMGEAGHQGVGVLLRQVEQCAAQLADECQQAVDFVAQVEPDVGSDLVVTRPTGVQLLANIADQLNQSSLDIHVHIFERHAPDEFA